MVFNKYLLFFIIYIIFVNLFGIVIMKIDKEKAKNGNYRISEKILFIIAILLGGVGIYSGMYMFRHKTKHVKFTVGIPITIVLNIICIYYIISHVYLTFKFN